MGFLPLALGMLADAYAAVGRLSDARRMLDESDEISGAENVRANTLRRRAELMARDGEEDGAVEAMYQDAVACARNQGTRAFELRAALSYARWLRDRGRGFEARAVLSPLNASLGEHFDTRDLHEARALLDDLEETDRCDLEARADKPCSGGVS